MCQRERAERVNENEHSNERNVWVCGSGGERCARAEGRELRARTNAFVERVNERERDERPQLEQRVDCTVYSSRNEIENDVSKTTTNENARNVSTRTREEHVNKNERANEIDGSSKIHPASYSVPYERTKGCN